MLVKWFVSLSATNRFRCLLACLLYRQSFLLKIVYRQRAVIFTLIARRQWATIGWHVACDLGMQTLSECQLRLAISFSQNRWVDLQNLSKATFTQLCKTRLAHYIGGIEMRTKESGSSLGLGSGRIRIGLGLGLCLGASQSFIAHCRQGNPVNMASGFRQAMQDVC